MRIPLAAIASLAICVSGCATIIKGSSQSIAVSTPPADGATCQLSSSQGNWSVVSPGTVTVERSKDDIAVHCVKIGFADASTVIPSGFNAWTMGNLLLGGLIGLGVDAATGAINQYPSSFQVPMSAVVARDPTAAPAASALPCSSQQVAQELAVAKSVRESGFQYHARCF